MGKLDLSGPASHSPAQSRGLRRASLSPSLLAEVAFDSGLVSGAELVVRRLVAYGITRVFYHPGGLAEPLIDKLLRFPEIALVSCRSDEGAVKAADGYFRAKRKPALVIITGGPAPLEIVGACGTALLDESAILIITGDVAVSLFGLDVVQESDTVGIDINAVLAPVTKRAKRVPAGSKLGAYFDASLACALTLPFGPVVLAIPRNYQKELGASSPVRKILPPARAYDPEALREALRILAPGSRVAILAGYACLDPRAWDALGRLAKALHAPLISTPRGKGSFDESSPWALGVIGLGGHETAEAAVAEADVLLAFAELDDLGTHNFALVGPSTQVVQILPAAEPLGRSKAIAAGVVGDAALVADEFARRVQISGETRRARSRWVESIRARRTFIRPQYLEQRPGRAMLQSRALFDLDTVLPRDTMKYSCVGSCMPFGLHVFRVTRPSSYFLPLGVGPTGWALPAAVGGAFAAPKRPTCALLGDVSLENSWAELSTAAEYGLDLLVTVIQNQGHAFVWTAGKEEFGVSFRDGPLPELPVAKIAKARGIPSCRATRPADVRKAIAAWRRSRGVFVLEIVVDRDQLPPIEGRLRGFISAK
jgi:acetolactate synthase I/II/III large subunit